MCGIAGYIGESKKPVLTYQLITKLFEKSESRGVDAAGFWGTQSGPDGRILYHKEPGKSSQFVKRDVWKRVSKFNPNMLLVHARGASKGVGEPYCNANNHPFTSSDKTIGLVHNGRIEDFEYHALKQKYEVSSACDSEILLRIFEAADDYTKKELVDFEGMDHPKRIAGIRDIFSLINDGHMAVAAGERQDDGGRLLWLFRNRHRPLWVVDMRESLGQVFFVSEPTIWDDAVRECSVKQLTRNQKLVELPVEEIWHFRVDANNPSPQVVKRYEVSRDRTNPNPWSFDGKQISIKRKALRHQLFTRLNEREEVLSATPRQKPVPAFTPIEPEYDLHALAERCEALGELAATIQATVENLVHEQSISSGNFQDILAALESSHNDLESIYTILER